LLLPAAAGSCDSCRMKIFLGRLARVVIALVLAVGVLLGTALAGSGVVQRDNSPAVSDGIRLPKPSPSSAGPVRVAVVLGQSGTEAADVLAPYQVLASSPRLSVYTVAANTAPVRLVGAPAVVPTYTFADIDTGAVPPPDLVVVPAVEDPAGPAEADARAWISRQAGNGAHILGVCAGSRLLAATGLLDGHQATSHWSRIEALRRSNPDVRWVDGQRYVQDGQFTTTAGVTSGIPGALQMVSQFAGPEEATRIGAAVGYPGWTANGSTAIPVQKFDGTDVPVFLNAVLPWFRPTLAVGLTNGIDELDAVAPFEVYTVSGAARTIGVGTTPTITTSHGLVLLATPLTELGQSVDRVVLPGAAAQDNRLVAWAGQHRLDVRTVAAPAEGGTAFDGALEELSRQTGQAAARTTAKFIDYPSSGLQLDTGAQDHRSLALLGLAVLLAGTVGLLPGFVRRRLRGSRAGRGTERQFEPLAMTTATKR
jgi:transcriptional regulator GlxA family with amidase domain